MSDKQLKEKAIDIKGKKYVLVSDRVTYFNETYPSGSINTDLVSEAASEMVIVKATVKPDADSTRSFTGYSQAVIGDGMVNKTAALENAETSAVGRALGFMGIGVIESIASADEMSKAKVNGNYSTKFATAKQVEWIRSTAAMYANLDTDEEIDAWVEKALTLKPESIPVYKVKDAVDKIKEIGQAERNAASKATKFNKEVILENIDDNFSLQDIPY